MKAENKLHGMTLKEQLGLNRQAYGIEYAVEMLKRWEEIKT